MPVLLRGHQPECNRLNGGCTCEPTLFESIEHAHRALGFGADFTRRLEIQYIPPQPPAHRLLSVAPERSQARTHRPISD